MTEKIALRQAVVVEGKYDKIRLESLVDALILTTDGFQIYKDKERLALIRSLAKTCGVVVLTDSDAAGFQLRGYLSGAVAEGELTHVYIPDLFGKEKRKRAPSAEGKLGVEGMDTTTLREAFRRAGVLDGSRADGQAPITRQDFYEDGLSGGENSACLRREFYRALGLPQRLSTTAALRLVNQMLSRRTYQDLVAELRAGKDGGA